jgi:hypothetical protein
MCRFSGALVLQATVERDRGLASNCVSPSGHVSQRWELHLTVLSLYKPAQPSQVNPKF